VTPKEGFLGTTCPSSESENFRNGCTGSFRIQKEPHFQISSVFLQLTKGEFSGKIKSNTKKTFVICFNPQWQLGPFNSYFKMFLKETKKKDTMNVRVKAAKMSNDSETNSKTYKDATTTNSMSKGIVNLFPNLRYFSRMHPQNQHFRRIQTIRLFNFPKVVLSLGTPTDQPPPTVSIRIYQWVRLRWLFEY
jgi:hypothetical protein